MEIKNLSCNIFDHESDAILFFIENSLLEDRSKLLVKESGERIIDILTRISGIETSETIVVPGFDTKSDYVILCAIPEEIKTDFQKDLFKRALVNSFYMAKKYKISSINVDCDYLSGKYGKEYVDIFNDLTRDEELEKEEIFLNLCRFNLIDN